MKIKTKTYDNNDRINTSSVIYLTIIGIVENQSQPSLVCEHTLESPCALKLQKSPLLSTH